MNADAGNMATIVIWGGFVLAFIFGAVAQQEQLLRHGGRVRHRQHGPLGPHADVAAGDCRGHGRRRRLAYSGQVDLAKSIAQRPTLPWLSLLVGGLCSASA